MDLSSLKLASKAEAGFNVKIVHPGDSSKVIGNVRVVGIDSKTYESAAKDMQTELTELRNSGKGEDRDARMLCQSRLIAKCMVDWDFKLDGKDLKSEYDEFFKVVSDREFRWLYDQLDAAIAQRSRLFQEPETP